MDTRTSITIPVCFNSQVTTETPPKHNRASTGREIAEFFWTAVPNCVLEEILVHLMNFDQDSKLGLFRKVAYKANLIKAEKENLNGKNVTLLVDGKSYNAILQRNS